MKIKTICLATALTVAALGVLGFGLLTHSAEARPYRFGWMVGHAGDFVQWRIERFMDKLKLDDGQRQQVMEVLRSHRPRIDTMRDEMRANVDRMLEVTPDDEVYDNAVAVLRANSVRLAGELIDVTAQLRTELYAILYPEQKRELAAMKERIRERIAEVRLHVDARRDEFFEKGFSY